MKLELISNVELTADGTLRLRLMSVGSSSYQYIYRAAAGVYWNPAVNAFEFATRNEGQIDQWFWHVSHAVLEELGVRLQLDIGVTWTNIPVEVRSSLMAKSPGTVP